VAFRRKKNEEPDASETAVSGAPDPEDVAATAEPPRGETPLSAHAASNGSDAHPEVFVGAAFVGGFALAQIMKRLGR
jgi:hypothetical protein